VSSLYGVYDLTTWIHRTHQSFFQTASNSPHHQRTANNLWYASTNPFDTLVAILPVLLISHDGINATEGPKDGTLPMVTISCGYGCNGAAEGLLYVVAGGGNHSANHSVEAATMDRKLVAVREPKARPNLDLEGEHGGVGEARTIHRCWENEFGKQFCQANVFFFGVSKCGEFSPVRLRSTHRTVYTTIYLD